MVLADAFSNALFYQVEVHLMKEWTYLLPDLHSYVLLRSELNVEAGYVLHGNRVVVAMKRWAKVLDLLLETHPGFD